MEKMQIDFIQLPDGRWAIYHDHWGARVFFSWANEFAEMWCSWEPALIGDVMTFESQEDAEVFYYGFVEDEIPDHSHVPLFGANEIEVSRLALVQG